METPANDQLDSRDERQFAVYMGYWVAVLAASISTFGDGGVRPGLTVIAYWACIFTVPRRLLRLLLMIPLAFFAIVIALIPLSLQGPNHQVAARKMDCGNRLRNLAIALRNYHDDYKSFPPAYIRSDDGRPMHSWRVLILPYLEGQQQLNDTYNMAEPWDSPSNRELIKKMPHVFCCPSQCKRGSETTGLTNYFAVVEEDTAWPGAQAIGFADITDGTSNTLLLLEDASQTVYWTEPTDNQYHEALAILTSDQLGPHQYKGFFYDELAGFNVALADASVQFVAQQADNRASELLLTRNDGEPFNVATLQKNVAAPMPLHTGNCVGLVAFLVLAILPFPWVWLKPK